MSDIQKDSLKIEEPVFAAIILAAGYSSRMKKFKPLLPIGRRQRHLKDWLPVSEPGE